MIPSAESGADLLVTAMSPAYVRIATFGAAMQASHADQEKRAWHGDACVRRQASPLPAAGSLPEQAS